MLAPVSITRSIQVLNSKGLKNLVSTSFIARFENGTEKVLNRKVWELKSLLRDTDLGDQRMSPSECTLYWKDWSNNPIFGTWDKNYPTESLLPTEIEKCI